MPPMPPMPPPPPPCIGGAGSFGSSATMASVVTSSAATEAASCSAVRTTLGRVDDAVGDHVDIFLGLRIEAERLGLVLEDLADDDRAFDAGILGDLAERRFQRLQHDIDAGLDVGIVVVDAADGLLGTQQGDAAARHDTFLHRRAGRVEGVLDAVLFLLD